VRDKMAASPPWEELEHTADLALRARGEDRRTLFRNAALGLCALMGGESASDDLIQMHIDVEAADWEALLYGWLAEVLYTIEEHDLFLKEVVIREIKDGALSADIVGNPDGRFSRQIKAVTFHDLAIRQVREGYEATIIFDV
jgi:SHS2 domain-containing protein